MTLSKFSLLFPVLYKKHLVDGITVKDIFLKRLFRFSGKVPGKIIRKSEGEIIYCIWDVNKKTAAIVCS